MTDMGAAASASSAVEARDAEPVDAGMIADHVGDEGVIDCNGRLWPKITKENAADHPAPDLRKIKTASRGRGSPPWCWYVQISGEADWDPEDTISYKRWKDKQDGWVGRRVTQRRESAQQSRADADGAARRAIAEQQVARARLYTLTPEQAPHAAFLDARAADMAASLLAAIGADGLVTFCSMELGIERRLHEQLQLCPQLWPLLCELDDERADAIGPAGPRCTATRFPAGRHQHYCDGRAEADAMDASDRGVATRVMPVSPLADDPFFADWNGPKLDWPGYTVTPEEHRGSVSEMLAWDCRWHWLVCQWDDSRHGNDSVFAELRRAPNDPQNELSLPPWLLIRRVLQILETHLALPLGGRRLWWRSVFYAPPGFASESDSRVHPTNAALISHMRLAGLGECLFTPRRFELLGKELARLGGLPLERASINHTGWMGVRTWYASASSREFGPKHPIMSASSQRPTPWWCPQRNVWCGQGCCATCVLPPNFVLPYIPSTGHGSADSSDKRMEQAILKALIDLDARQRQLCSVHVLKDPANAAYDDFTCQMCAWWAKGPPSSWWRNYALMYWPEDGEVVRDDEGKEVGEQAGASSVNRWSKDKNWGRLGASGQRATTSYALALQDCNSRNWQTVTSFAFASPGFCPEHWQVGRATMTVLGFRAVHAGEVKRFVEYPGGIASASAEDEQVAKDEGEAPEAIPYARWDPAHSERTAREHLAARHAELQTHVVHALHRPDGPSRVDQLARCILASPIPELPAQPAPALLPSSESQSVTTEAESAMEAMCVACE